MVVSLRMSLSVPTEYYHRLGLNHFVSDLGFFSVVAMSDRNYFVEDSYSVGNLDTYGISASTISLS